MPLAGELAVPPLSVNTPSLANAGPSSGTTTLLTDTVTVNLVNGKTYKIEHNAGWSQTVLTDQFQVAILQDNAAGAFIQAYRLPAPQVVNQPTGMNTVGYYTAGATAAKTLVVVVTRMAGTGTVTRIGNANQPSNLLVLQIT